MTNWRATSVHIADGIIHIYFDNDRVVTRPLSDHEWLASATPQQQANYVIHPFSIDWPNLDEGLDIEGFIRGNPSRKPKE
jgi:hypothetical protein